MRKSLMPRSSIPGDQPSTRKVMDDSSLIPAPPHLGRRRRHPSLPPFMGTRTRKAWRNKRTSPATSKSSTGALVPRQGPGHLLRNLPRPTDGRRRRLLRTRAVALPAETNPRVKVTAIAEGQEAVSEMLEYYGSKGDQRPVPPRADALLRLSCGLLRCSLF